MHRCLAATHQGWPETLRQERVAQRSGIPDDENTIAMKAVMAIPDAQTTMLSLAGIFGKAKVRQQLSKHSVAVQFIAADEAADADIHTTRQREGPGEALGHEAEFKAGRAVIQ